MKVTNSFFLIGPMGSGKTTIAKLIVGLLGYEFFDSDHYLVERTGADIPLIFELEGEAGFRAREKFAIDELTMKNNIVLATGGGAVMTEENREFLVKRGTVIYLNVPPAVQYERVRFDKNRPLLQNSDPLGTLETLYKQRDPIYKSIADYIVLSENRHSKLVAEQLIEILINPHREIDCDWIIKNR